jgi:hypothetical protein
VHFNRIRNCLLKVIFKFKIKIMRVSITVIISSSFYCLRNPKKLKLAGRVGSGSGVSCVVEVGMVPSVSGTSLVVVVLNVVVVLIVVVVGVVGAAMTVTRTVFDTGLVSSSAVRIVWYSPASIELSVSRKSTLYE